MGKYRMSWKKLLATQSQRERSSRKLEVEEYAHKKGEKTISDLRNDFERDYHRILSSPSFRRLQDKTQVFPLEKNDFIRTRLTHSIEVSSFGKSLAQSVSSEIIRLGLDEDFGYGEATAIGNILSSAGLLHDIGNPPFGHFGEDTVRAWFKNNLSKIKIEMENGEYKPLNSILTEQMSSDLLNFEGNAQALRVASKLHFLIDENGMNLTYGLLNTLIKYPVDSLHINKKSGDIKTKKMGYYYSEENLFWKIVSATGTYDENRGEVYRHPLTFLLEAADDIAYCTADVEDGVKKRFIKLEDILESLRQEIPEDTALYKNLIKYKDYAKEMNYDDPELYAVQRWVVEIQGILIREVVKSFINNYSFIMDGNFKTDLFKGTEVENLLKMMKKLTYRKVFMSKAIAKMEITANNIINYFLDNFIDAILYWETEREEKMSGINWKYISVLSETHRYIFTYYMQKYIESEEIKGIRNEDNRREKIFAYRLYLKILLVTDYLSGMTDSFMKTLYQQLVGID